MKRLLSIVLLFSVGAAQGAKNNAASPAFNAQVDTLINTHEDQQHEIEQALKKTDLKGASSEQIAPTIEGKKALTPIKKAHETSAKAIKTLKTKGKEGIESAKTTVNKKIEATNKKIDSLQTKNKKYEDLARRHKSSSYMCKIGELEAEIRGHEKAIQLLKKTRDVELNSLKEIED